MAAKKLQPWARDAWELTRRQHGVVTRRQLLDLGMPPGRIRARLEGGQLHPLWAGVYAVGRPDVGPLGRFKAATLACGADAQLSHRSAAALWGLRAPTGGPVEVAVPSSTLRRRRGILLHRRARLGPPRFVRGIPVIDPVSVLVDLAAESSREEVEDAVNEADRLDLIRAHRLRGALERQPRRPGLGRLKAILDSQTFSRAQNALERRFLAIVREGGLPPPVSQRRLGRHRVDFFWPDLGFVVETDSLRHHRTAAEQATDIGRDQAHARAGLRTLRFTHSQVFHRPDHVCAVLKDAFDHLFGASTGAGVPIA
ncbi:MAG TPA: type IV toxin-antitoxin system AbiEi family antitoxin domain-containing protein [Solirubrobacterales bacterium]